VLRRYAHHQFLSEQIAVLEAARCAMLRTSKEAPLEKGRQWMHRRGIGINEAWVLVMDVLAGGL
jgi:hypothetical protein